ncbi:hypothetical protein [Phaeovulum sp.]|uniref:hypothetical protein n=1 Tax=Phaeovulum sp. TaxID=2934796 RepID=UPI0027319C5C|nr:hypothetical protein [Phaeovulum sp.]MDP1667446.1 hypothetical protein [Phaeovulum sp.]MDZ4119963.1 hypothetical protein [Phaeovulum sp.]
MGSLAGFGNALPRTVIAIGVGLTIVIIYCLHKGLTIEETRSVLAGEGAIEGLIWTLAVIFAAYVLGEIAITVGESWLPAIPKFTKRPELGELLLAAAKQENAGPISIALSELRKFELFCGLFSCAGFVVIDAIIRIIKGDPSLLLYALTAALFCALLANLHARRAAMILKEIAVS